MACLAPTTCETIFGGKWKVHIPISVIMYELSVYQNTQAYRSCGFMKLIALDKGDFYQRPFKEEYSEFETDMEKVAKNVQHVGNAILGRAALCLL